MKDNSEEMFPLIDEEGNITGAASRGECHNGSKLLHPVVHLHVFNSRGELYLQKRPEWKDIQPGKWDTAVGGHIDLGESVEMALKREAREELGIEDFTPQLLTHYVFESDREKELVFAHKTVYDGVIKIFRLSIFIRPFLSLFPVCFPVFTRQIARYHPRKSRKTSSKTILKLRQSKI